MTSSKPTASVTAVLAREVYAQPAIDVARALLGCTLVHVDDGVRRGGRIVETEAYLGPHDRACHASKGRSARTESMFLEPGHAYVYLIYGMYDCFNVVTDRVDYPAAVLIRALAPLEGCLGDTDGPGKLCRALRITRRHDRLDLASPTSSLFLEAGPPPAHIDRGPRVGVDYAGSWARRHLRFWARRDPWVSGVSAAIRRLRSRG